MIADLSYLTPEECEKLIEYKHKGEEIFIQMKEKAGKTKSIPGARLVELDELSKAGIQNLIAMYDLIETAELREIAQYEGSPKKVLAGALIQLDRTVKYLTQDYDSKSNLWARRFDKLPIIADFEHAVKHELDSFIASLMDEPECYNLLTKAIEIACGEYPSQMICYPDNYPDREADVIKYGLGEPIRRTKGGYIYAYKEIDWDDTPQEEEGEDSPEEAEPKRPKKPPDFAGAFLPGYTQIMLDLVRRPNGLLANQAFRTPLEKENRSTHTSTKGGKKAKKYRMVSLFSLDEELRERGIEIKRLGTFNDLVYSVIYSVWYQECIINKKKFAIIYPENIYRNINHLDNNATVPAGAVEEIEKAIEIFRGTTAKADVTEFLNEWGLDQTIGKLVTNGIIDQKLLVATGAEFTLQNGSKIKGYYVSSANEPTLGAFSRCFKEITRIPAEMLTCEDKDNSIERAAIRYHLANAIQTMRYDKKFNRTVRLDPLYKDILGKSLDELSKDKRRKLKNYITSYLDYLKREGHIVDYEYQKDGRTISAISFTVKQLKPNGNE